MSRKGGTGVHVGPRPKESAEDTNRRLALGTPRFRWRVYHVHPSRSMGGRGLWVMRDFKLKRTAVIYARSEARIRTCELYVHGLDGKIQSRNSYGEDSPRRRG